MPRKIMLAFAAAFAFPVEAVGGRGTGGEEILFQDIPAVFGASRYEQKLSEAPAAVTIVTADEIKRYGHRTLADILRSVRGFYTANDRAYTYAGVRGFGRLGDYNTRVLLLIDGYRTNDNIFDQAFIGTESLVDVDTIDRVEVIHGPGSSLYGTNAFFATINVITRRGRDLKGAEVSAEGGSFRSNRGRVSYGDKYENGAEMLLAASYYDSAGRSLYFAEFDDPATNNGVAENVDAERYRNFFGKLSAGDYTLTAGYVEHNKALPTGAFDTVFNDPGTRLRDPVLGFVNVKYERAIAADAQLMLRLGQNRYRYQGSYVYPTETQREDDYGAWWTAEAVYTARPARGHRLVAGAEYQGNSRQDQSTVNEAGVLLDDRRDSARSALYVQDELRLREDLLVNVGARGDRYESFGGTVNPRLGLLYAASAQTTVKLLYGEAFRAPNVFEIYYSDGAVTQKGNPDLKPETIATSELVVEQDLGGGLRGAASLYRYTIRDLITQQVDPNDGLLVFRNVERVTAEGIELELGGWFAARFEGRASYAYQASTDAGTGERLVNSPRALAKLNVSTPFIERRLRGGVELQYTGPRLTRTRAETGGFTVVNLTLLARNWVKGLELSASLYNVLDKAYADPVSDSYAPETIAQDGRRYRLKAAYEF